MALEGIETQDIAQAIERHSARYGVPAEMFIDQGTQLKAMSQALFSVRDLQMQVIDSLGIRLQVSNAKSHEDRGRVERKIRTVRETLEKTGVKTSSPKTPLLCIVSLQRLLILSMISLWLGVTLPTLPT